MKPIRKTNDDISRILFSTRGQALDLLFRNITVVDVITHELRVANVGILGRHIVYVGSKDLPATRIMNGSGKYLSPGLMDAHIHVESTMLDLPSFASVVLPRGTTAVFSDPHEIANVFGFEGVNLFLSSIDSIPMRIFVQVPSRVPNMPNLEGTGGILAIDDTIKLLDHEASVSLGEIPVSLLLDSDQSEELILEIEAAHFHRKLINGHAPASGLDLSTYIATGINDDHTCISVENGIEKIRSGMWLMIKEGSLDKNLETLHPLMKSYPTRCNLCTDDILPNELIELGHMDHLVRKAIGLGVSPTTAIASATYNIAQRYHLEEYIGSITPGKVADILVLEDLNKFAIEQVFVEGREIVEEGKFLIRPGEWDLPDWATNSVRLPALAPSSFLIPSDTDSVVRVIELLPGIGARNKASTWKARSSQGYLCAGDNVNHLSVINRYGNNRVANGFCRGFSIRGGAIASTIAHDHHNLVIVGDNEESMYRAALSISEMNGGLVVVKGRDVIACLPLPIGGLMSDLPSKELVNRLNACTKAAWKLGCSLENPFISLSFIGLTTMPDYGFTDIGLIDANRNEIISVFLSPTR